MAWGGECCCMFVVISVWRGAMNVVVCLCGGSATVWREALKIVLCLCGGFGNGMVWGIECCCGPVHWCEFCSAFFLLAPFLEISPPKAYCGIRYLK